jgi:hypothetical protein
VKIVTTPQDNDGSKDEKQQYEDKQRNPACVISLTTAKKNLTKATQTRKK